jgi:hypothetical protein
MSASRSYPVISLAARRGGSPGSRDGKVPHPTTLMKLTTQCGADAVAGLKLLPTAGPGWCHGDSDERGPTRRLRAAGQVVGKLVKWRTECEGSAT